MTFPAETFPKEATAMTAVNNKCLIFLIIPQISSFLLYISLKKALPDA